MCSRKASFIKKKWDTLTPSCSSNNRANSFDYLFIVGGLFSLWFIYTGNFDFVAETGVEVNIITSRKGNQKVLKVQDSFYLRNTRFSNKTEIASIYRPHCDIVIQ